MDAQKQKETLDLIQAKIKESCPVNKYNHLCQRIQSDAGLAWTTNRCISMMAEDKIHLSAALAYLESELEGMV